MLDKSSVFNVLAEGMYFLDKEVAQTLHVIFETRSQFLYKLCSIVCNILAKT